MNLEKGIQNCNAKAVSENSIKKLNMIIVQAVTEKTGALKLKLLRMNEVNDWRMDIS